MAANGTASGLSRAISATAMPDRPNPWRKVVFQAMLDAGDLDRAGKARQATRQQHSHHHQPFGAQAGVKRRARTGADNAYSEAERRPRKHERHCQGGDGGDDDAGMKARVIDQDGQYAIVRNGKGPRENVHRLLQRPADRVAGQLDKT